MKTPGNGWEPIVASVVVLVATFLEVAFQGSKRGRGQEFWSPGLVTVSEKCKAGMLSQGSSSVEPKCLETDSATICLVCWHSPSSSFVNYSV